MAESRDGLGMLEERVARRRRAVPAPRHPGPLVEHPDTRQLATGDAAMHPQPAARPAAAPKSTQPPLRDAGVAGHPDTRPDESLRNLALRVRATLDERLNDLVYQLRREGVRTSKVELVELLLWDLPAQPSATIRSRLEAFRRTAPRLR